MTMHVLKNKREITNAREYMSALGVDCADGRIKTFLKRFHLISGDRFGDHVKSWDLLKTIQFINENIDKKNPILDLGAYCSEILPALECLGYTELIGIDLNPNINKMPSSNNIKYMIGNFFNTNLPAQSMAAITAISVIEHGFDSEKLLSEVSRLLQPGGYFIVSADYWSKKIDTTGIQVFGLDWMIFSPEEIKNFFIESSRYGLSPVGALDFETDSAPINWSEKSYTFAWFVLKKNK
jgi:SAM-dependent methyltransferase